jgi:hypothetical protein
MDGWVAAGVNPACSSTWSFLFAYGCLGVGER